MIIAIITMVSCSEDDKNDLDSYNFSGSFDMKVVNAAGEDLLDPQHPNAINPDNVKLYYYRNGVSEEVFNPDLHAPRNFWVIQDPDGGEYMIRMVPNYYEAEGNTITYIEWNESDTDTIESEFSFHDDATLLHKVWYNGELKLDTATALEFTVVK